MTKLSATHKMLAFDFDIASTQFAMNWAIEDGEFDEAMSLHFEYLYYKDEQNALWRSMTRPEMDAYFSTVASIEGWKYETN